MTRSHLQCNFSVTYEFNATALGCVTANAYAAGSGRAVEVASLSTTMTGKDFEGFEGVARLTQSRVVAALIVSRPNQFLPSVPTMQFAATSTFQRRRW